MGKAADIAGAHTIPLPRRLQVGLFVVEQRLCTCQRQSTAKGKARGEVRMNCMHVAGMCCKRLYSR